MVAAAAAAAAVGLDHRVNTGYLQKNLWSGFVADVVSIPMVHLVPAPFFRLRLSIARTHSLSACLTWLAVCKRQSRLGPLDCARPALRSRRETEREEALIVVFTWLYLWLLAFFWLFSCPSKHTHSDCHCPHKNRCFLALLALLL